MKSWITTGCLLSFASIVCGCGSDSDAPGQSAVASVGGNTSIPSDRGGSTGVGNVTTSAGVAVSSGGANGGAGASSDSGGFGTSSNSAGGRASNASAPNRTGGVAGSGATRDFSGGVAGDSATSNQSGGTAGKAGSSAKSGGNAGTSVGIGGAAGQSGVNPCDSRSCACEPRFVDDNCNLCVVHVRADGDDTNNASTWAHAVASVQLGLEIAAARIGGSVTTCEVWVAAGTYKPTGADRNATIQLKAKVGLYGGFTGSELQRAERNFAANKTVLSGDIGQLGEKKDNCYHVVTGANDAILDGFTITGGNANTMGPGGQTGGGMYNVSVSPTVNNCTFSSNSAGDGGAMYNGKSFPIVSNCAFSDNVADRDGGAIYNGSASSPTMTRCTFTNNKADYGAAVANFGSSSPTIANCTFSGNSAKERAGAIDNYESSPTLTNCVFSNNAAAYGGGMYNTHASPTLTNCLFSGNSATYGGGMSNAVSSPNLTNCTFVGNSATDNGGALLNSETSAPTFTNCTFSENSAVIASGMMNYRLAAPSITNCVFWDDITFGSEFYDESGSKVSVSYSIVRKGYSGTGNIDLDPLFVDSAKGDFHLRAGSPAIDQGADGCPSAVPLVDQDGNARWNIASIDNAAGMRGVDIGAYEFQGGSADNKVTTLCQ